jgi:hypothetical protein
MGGGRPVTRSLENSGDDWIAAVAKRVMMRPRTEEASALRSSRTGPSPESMLKGTEKSAGETLAETPVGSSTNEAAVTKRSEMK